jgi:hypothetical protein
MCAFYISWICWGYNFLSICVINWIKCMDGWMTCCHKIFTKKKKKKNDIVCGQYTIACKMNAKWDGKDLKTIKIDQIFFIINFFHFLM